MTNKVIYLIFGAMFIAVMAAFYQATSLDKKRNTTAAAVENSRVAEVCISGYRYILAWPDSYIIPSQNKSPCGM